jgi:pSer/pThr/pTyr-binding forkhead associated (FHA) protein
LKLADRNGAGEEDFDRTIILSENSTVLVGRASKTENKALVPAPSNAWIRNPVISRSHAELSVHRSLGTPYVHIQDKSSSHGTFVNGHNIKDQKHRLSSQDRLQFGADVTRGTGKLTFYISLPSILPVLSP